MTPCRPHSPGSTATRAAADAAAFVAAQAACLAQGLAAARTPGLLRAVLEQHEASHGRWLATIGWARRADAAVGALLADLYAQHGRSAGALERAGSPLLRPEVRERVLALHARDLAALTAAARLALEGIDTDRA